MKILHIFLYELKIFYFLTYSSDMIIILIKYNECLGLFSGTIIPKPFIPRKCHFEFFRKYAKIFAALGAPLM
jgi:hypothetical protein